ncbi:hypothetical protein RIR_e48931_A0A2N1KZT0_9GLOM [Rhizophagus irregularis DAOM 181602=DAOM 197198]|nr:hypothetical protein RIR_e48931_A0A2N1KZT0_9GLOM [Rhizophagus irregularis DAOM 181602=DAOM 197198]
MTLMIFDEISFFGNFKFQKIEIIMIDVTHTSKTGNFVTRIYVDLYHLRKFHIKGNFKKGNFKNPKFQISKF